MIVLGGFALVFLDTAKGLLSQATSITVVRPQMVTDAGPGPGSIVFQAAGWIEPDPYPVRVTALAKGVVKKMLVEEADPVKANDVMCELVSDDALIAVAAAEAALAHAQANVTLVQVEKKNAQESFIEAIDVTEARDSAKAELRMQQAEHQRRKAAAQEAGRLASQAAQPISDKRGTAQYRREITAVLTRRVLAEAARRAREKN